MTEALLFIAVAMLVAVVILQIVQLRRNVAIDLSPIQQALQSVENSYERIERAVRDEIAKNREEASTAAGQSREELSRALKGMGDSLNNQLATLTQTNGQKLDQMRDTVEQRLQLIQEDSTKKLEQVRQDSLTSAKNLREEVGVTLKGFNESLVNNIGEMGRLQKAQLDVFSESVIKTLSDMGGNQRLQLTGVVDQLTKLTAATEEKLDTQKTAIDNRLKQIQTDSLTSAKEMREEVGKSLKAFNDSVLKTMTGLSEIQKHEMEGLKTTVEQNLKGIQEDNAKQLDKMRATVDERLQSTLEKRLGDSFKQVSERLEQVHKGLGEMQALATGVGDLKKMLTNVKTRGTWGEVQLGAMLEQILTPDQFSTNVATKEGGERVEFAVKLPGHGDDKDEVVWLPIDAKFPIEDYQRLVEAQEKADPEAAEVAVKQLEIRIKSCASDICEKYLNPPKTTDFGILFLPTEGLFAEVIRRTGLPDFIQREYRVVIAGPTTLWSILNSLQMGFRTLAIQQRSSEVWNLLAAVKTEWTKYGDVLGKVQKKLQEASNTVDDATRRTKAIGRKLKNVQELPAKESRTALMIEPGGTDEEPEEE